MNINEQVALHIGQLVLANIELSAKVEGLAAQLIALQQAAATPESSETKDKS